MGLFRRCGKAQFLRIPSAWISYIRLRAFVFIKRVSGLFAAQCGLPGQHISMIDILFAINPAPAALPTALHAAYDASFDRAAGRSTLLAVSADARHAHDLTI